MPTKISWCDEVWNPITGCEPISAGCKNCYAKRMANRLRGRFGYPQDDPFKPGTVHWDKLTQPFHFKKSRRIFVGSMGDLFHDTALIRIFERIMNEIIKCPQHTFIMLTKRPKKMFEVLQGCDENALGLEFEYLIPLPNLWLGVSISKKDDLWMIEELLKIPAAKRFVSVEPMLGEINLQQNIRKIDWTICGAETGPGARPMARKWARSLRDQCKAAGVPFFMKQMSDKAPIPDDLNIKEFPQGEWRDSEGGKKWKKLKKL